METTFDGETFRDVPGSDGKLWASASGKVLSTAAGMSKRPPRLLKAYADRDGYLIVGQRTFGNKNYVAVHKAVLLAWRGPKPDGFQARHLNGIKEDNRVENLVWGTVVENGMDKRRHGSVKGVRNHRAKLTEQMVLSLRAEYQTKPLRNLVAENRGYSKFTIWAAVSGYTWSHLPGAIPKNRRCSKGVKACSNSKDFRSTTSHEQASLTA